MNYYLTIFILVPPLFCLFGCNRPVKQDSDLWQGVKITDIAATSPQEQKDLQSGKIADFTVYSFEMPADKFADTSGIWSQLNETPLKFTNAEAFKNNGFAAGFGRGLEWNKIAEKLKQANAKRVRTSSVLFFKNKTDEVELTTLQSEKTIFFTDKNDSMTGLTLAAGSIALRLKISEISGVRGGLYLDLRPVYKPFVTTPTYSKMLPKKSDEVVFDSAGFGFTAGQSDFVLLGPNVAPSGGMTLGDTLFAEQKNKSSVIKMYLIVCRGMKN